MMPSNQPLALDVYVNYPGHCEDAFRFYETHLGGKLTMLLHHQQLPPHFPNEWKSPVLHAIVEIGGTLLRGADVPGAEPMRSAYLTLRFDAAEEAEAAYVVLSPNGEIFMPLEKTFFANRFALLRDRFGTSWMLLHQD